MDETPQFNSPSPKKTHHRHTSITTIADNVSSDDSASLSSKGSNSTSTSLVSIQVRPKSPDLSPPEPQQQSVVLDNNSNVVPTQGYPKEVPRSKVRYYQPNNAIDSKPRQLTHSYKYFSGPPARFRDYKYREYKAKNTDIPQYRDYKYREYKNYREYKLTPWNTFWLGGYKEHVMKPVPKKPKPVGRPKKPPRKIGILSAHSLFYPYSEFKYKPYEKVKEYKYRDYSGYKEYRGYKEYKGRQIPLSTLYNFIGIWRPLGSKGPIPWKKQKNFDPPCRTMLPPEEGTKFYNPPSRYMVQPAAAETVKEEPDFPTKLYDPPQKTVTSPGALKGNEPTDCVQEFKVYDPPQKQLVMHNPAEGFVYSEETKDFDPPQKVIIPAVVASAVVQTEIIPTQAESAMPQSEYIEEVRTYDPPLRTIEAPKEYTEESKDYNPLHRQLSPPREYIEESKDFDPQQKELLPPREYTEETRVYDPPAAELNPPREYTEENKTLELQEKHIYPPSADSSEADVTQPAIDSDVIQQQILSPVYSSPPEEYVEENKLLDPPIKLLAPPPEQNQQIEVTQPIIVAEIGQPQAQATPPDIAPQYEPEEKTFDLEERIILPREIDVTSEHEEDLATKSVILPNSAKEPEVITYTEEEKTLEHPERQIQPPAEIERIRADTADNKGNTPSENKIEAQDSIPPAGGQLDEYEEEMKAFSPLEGHKILPVQPNSSHTLQKEVAEIVNGDATVRELPEKYTEESRPFSPPTAHKTPPPAVSNPPRIEPKQPATLSAPVVAKEPTVAASGYAPNPNDVKEAWQDTPSQVTPLPMAVSPSPENNRPVSEPASESSIINQKLVEERDPSPQVLPIPSPKPKSPPPVVVLPQAPIVQARPPSDAKLAPDADRITPTKELPSRQISPKFDKSQSAQDPPPISKPPSPLKTPVAANRSPTQTPLSTSDRFVQSPAEREEQTPITYPSAGATPENKSEALEAVVAEPAAMSWHAAERPPSLNRKVSLSESSSRETKPASVANKSTPPNSSQDDADKMPQQIHRELSPIAVTASLQADDKPTTPTSPSTQAYQPAPKHSTPQYTPVGRPTLQPIKLASPIAVVAEPVAQASSDFPPTAPDSPYKKVSPRVQVLENRGRKPEMSLGGNENNTISVASPRQKQGATLGSIRRTMRLLGK